EYDSTATSLRGYGGYLRLAKDNGDWLWGTAANFRSPGFEVNDLAYLQRSDYLWGNVNLARLWTVPNSWCRSLYLLVGGQTQQNYDGDRTDLEGRVFTHVQFHNWWDVAGFYIYRPALLDDQATRGGPVVKTAGYQDAAISLHTDARRRFYLNAFIEGNI